MVDQQNSGSEALRAAASQQNSGTGGAGQGTPATPNPNPETSNAEKPAETSGGQTEADKKGILDGSDGNMPTFRFPSTPCSFNLKDENGRNQKVRCPDGTYTPKDQNELKQLEAMHRVGNVSYADAAHFTQWNREPPQIKNGVEATE